MSARIFLVVGAIACCCLTGCEDSHEAVLSDGLKIMRNVQSEMQAGGNRRDVQAKYQPQMQALQERLKKLGPIAPTEQRRLAEKYASEFRGAFSGMPGSGMPSRVPAASPFPSESLFPSIPSVPEPNAGGLGRRIKTP